MEARKHGSTEARKHGSTGDAMEGALYTAGTRPDAQNAPAPAIRRFHHVARLLLLHHRSTRSPSVDVPDPARTLIASEETRR